MKLVLLIDAGDEILEFPFNYSSVEDAANDFEKAALEVRGRFLPFSCKKLYEEGFFKFAGHRFHFDDCWELKVKNWGTERYDYREPKIQTLDEWFDLRTKN